MIIGFAYDLKDDYLNAGYTKDQVAEMDSLTAIDAIAAAIEVMGHSVDRIGNFFALSKRLQNNERWDLVFNICEGLYGSGRESLVPAVLDAYNIPYTFSDPLVHAVTLNKAVAKRVLRDGGLPTTDFIVISDPAEAVTPPFGYPCFVKAVSEGTGKGITPKSKVYTDVELVAQAKALIDEFKQPVIVEPLLTGREVTVGVLGTGAEAFCAGVMNIGFTDMADSDIHSYYNKENCETAAVYTHATDAFGEKCAEIAVRAHRLLGVKDACRVDIRANELGEPQILEINSLPGLTPVRSDLVILGEMAGHSYQSIIETIVNSALSRCASQK